MCLFFRYKLILLLYCLFYSLQDGIAFRLKARREQAKVNEQDRISSQRQAVKEQEKLMQSNVAAFVNSKKETLKDNGKRGGRGGKRKGGRRHAQI